MYPSFLVSADCCFIFYAPLVDVIPFQTPSFLRNSLAGVAADSTSRVQLLYPRPDYSPFARAHSQCLSSIFDCTAHLETLWSFVLQSLDWLSVSQMGKEIEPDLAAY